MKDVTIYGAETSRFEYFKYNLEDFLKKNQIDLPINVIKDVDRLIEDNVRSIPSLRVNGTIDIVYDNEKGIDHFLSLAKAALIGEFAKERFTKIVVPVDFSEASLNALDYAVDFGRQKGAVIDIVHVHHPSPVVVNGVVVAQVDYVKKNSVKALVKIANDYDKKRFNGDDTKEKDVIINPMYLEGLAGDVIVSLSKKADYIIMGQTGAGETLKKILGSVSSSVSAKSKCPVLLIPEHSNFRPISKVVFGHSKTKYDFETIEQLNLLAGTFDASLDFVHVKDGSDYDTGEINDYMAHMFPNVDFSFEVIEAENIGMGLNNYAWDNKADIIVVAKKKKNLLERLVARSQTKSTINKAVMPVMVLHKDDVSCKCGGSCKKLADDKCDH